MSNQAKPQDTKSANPSTGSSSTSSKQSSGQQNNDAKIGKTDQNRGGMQNEPRSDKKVSNY